VFELDTALSFIKNVVPRAIVLRESSAEVSIELPLDDGTRNADLIALLNVQGKSLGIKSFGLAMPALEEVFLRLQNGGVGDEGHTAPAPKFAALHPALLGETTWASKVSTMLPNQGLHQPYDAR
jgi:hypothetical protein